MKSLIKLLFTMASLFFLLLDFSHDCFGMENAFYVLRTKDPKQVKELLSTLSLHKKAINLLISQAYHIDKKGIVNGSIDSSLLNFTSQNNIKLMALVTNSSFDQDIAHIFLANPHAQKNALYSLLDVCRKNHLYGIQLDFENIALKDKAALTRFYQAAANLFHSQGYAVSVAVIPVVTNGPFASAFQKRQYENWSGAYDLKALGKSSDFITIMAYDQHVGTMSPGPIASIRWVEKILQHALLSIPAEKISLGIPLYSGFWYTGTTSDKPSAKITLQYNAICYKTVVKLLNKYDARVHWDEEDKVNYTFYEHNWLNQYIFIEDAKSFKAKLALAKKYGLRGISVFRIGGEDAKTWDVLSG